MLNIPRAPADDVIAHALAEDPNECCGVMAADGAVAARTYRITNQYASPYRYRMDPQEFLSADRDAEARGLEIAVFYHSHTHSEAYPSDTDVRLAIESGYVDGLVGYLLISLKDRAEPQLRLFRITADGEIIERELAVT